jgi:hypothetical protein
MELFSAAGIELPLSDGRTKGAPAALPRSPRVPLFNYKVIEEALGIAAFAPTPEEVAAAADYARKVISLTKSLSPVRVQRALQVHRVGAII